MPKYTFILFILTIMLGGTTGGLVAFFLDIRKQKKTGER
jgi:hypothetical protein